MGTGLGLRPVGTGLGARDEAGLAVSGVAASEGGSPKVI